MRVRRPGLDETLEYETADTRKSLSGAVHRLRLWSSASYRYDANGHINGILDLLVQFALMTPVGLQQDAVDLLQVDAPGAVSDRLEQAGDAEVPGSEVDPEIRTRG